MVFQPGQSGNPGGRGRDKPFRDALTLAVNEAEGDVKKLRAVANSLVKQAISGDVAAINAIADRIDGKVPQAQVHMGDEDGGPITTRNLPIGFVEPGNDPTAGGIPPVVSTEPV